MSGTVDFYHRRDFSTPGKTALLLPDETSQDHLETFKALASPLPIELQVFSSREDGESWLVA